MIPTIIDINPWVCSDIDDEESHYYNRTEVSFTLRSTQLFERVIYQHLGFRSRRDGKRAITRKDDRYSYIGILDPESDASLTITPFKLYLRNLGDSFLGVHVRLPGGIETCKVTILQEQHQPKAPKVVDVVRYEGVCYASATINTLQTIRIEELKGDNNNAK